MIEIRQFDILRKRISKTNPQNKKITEFGFDLAEKSSNEQRWNFWKIKIAKTKIKNEINSNYISKMKSKAKRR